MLLNGLDYGSVTVVHRNSCLEVNVGGKELSEEPRSKNLLGIVLLEDTERGTLRDNLGLLGIYLRDRGDTYFKLKHTVSLLGLLVGSATGRTDTHVATSAGLNLALGAGAALAGEERGGVTAGKLLGGYPLVLVPSTELGDEVDVGLVVEYEVFTGSGGVGRTVLLAHGDEPVGLGVIAERNRGGLDFLDLLDYSFHLVPSGGNGEFVLLEEGLVVVKNLGRLGERKRIHLTVTEGLTLVVVTLDEVVKLLLSEANVGILDKNVERLNCACYVVKSNVVGIAVSKVGLVTNGDLGLDLIANAVVVTKRLMLDGDVGVKLVEICDCIVEDFLKSCAHGVIELDSYCASVIATLGHYEVCRTVLLAKHTAGSSECKAEYDDKHKDKCDNSFHVLHPFLFLFFNDFRR